MAPDQFARYDAAMRYVLRIDHPEEDEPFVPSATVEIGVVKVELDLSGTVDLVAERFRLTKDLVTAQKDRETARIKLSNENFMSKAPANVLLEIRERLEKTDADIARISAQLTKLPTV